MKPSVEDEGKEQRTKRQGKGQNRKGGYARQVTTTSESLPINRGYPGPPNHIPDISEPAPSFIHPFPPSLYNYQYVLHIMLYWDFITQL